MKKAQPYLPLYVQDVLTDPNLCACSASACGLYLFLLCVLHKQEEYGVYRLWDDAGETDVFPLFAKQLSRQMPLSADEIEPALRELVRRKALISDGDRLVLQQMREQNLLSEQRASAGQKGGSKTKSKKFHTEKTFASDFASAKSETNAENEIENESEIDIENKSKERIEGVQGEEGEKSRFEEMWAVYPRKTEKAAARKAYDARLKDGWSPDELYLAAKAYAALCLREKREQRYIKHAAVFFGVSTPFADHIPRASPDEEEDDLRDCF